MYDGAAMSSELICSKVCFGTVAATLTSCVEAIAKHHLSLARMAAGVTIDVAIDAPCPKPTEPPWERKSARVGTAVIPGAKHTAATPSIVHSNCVAGDASTVDDGILSLTMKGGDARKTCLESHKRHGCTATSLGLKHISRTRRAVLALQLVYGVRRPRPWRFKIRRRHRRRTFGPHRFQLFVRRHCRPKKPTLHFGLSHFQVD